MLKNKKQIIIKQIIKNYNYLLFCKYNCLTIKQLNSYKTFLKLNSIKIKFIKNKLIPNTPKRVINHNSTTIVYCKEFNALQKLYQTFNLNPKLQFNYLLHKKKIYSNYKLKNLIENNPLQVQLRFSLINFYRVISNIK